MDRGRTTVLRRAIFMKNGCMAIKQPRMYFYEKWALDKNQSPNILSKWAMAKNHGPNILLRWAMAKNHGPIYRVVGRCGCLLRCC